MIVFIDVITWLQLQMHRHKRTRLTFLQVRMILFPGLCVKTNKQTCCTLYYEPSEAVALDSTASSDSQFFLIAEKSIYSQVLSYSVKTSRAQEPNADTSSCYYIIAAKYPPPLFVLHCSVSLLECSGTSTVQKKKKKEPNQISFKCGRAHLLPITPPPPEVVRLIELPVMICKGTLSERRLPFSFFTIGK